MKILTTILFFFSAFAPFLAKAGDTLYLDAKSIKPAQVKHGTNRYLVYFKNNKDASRTRYQFWTRIVTDTMLQDRQAVAIRQSWEDNDTIFHTAYSVCDNKTFAPLFHQTWWRKRGVITFDFRQKSAFLLGKPLTANDTAAFAKNMYQAFAEALEQQVYNWHLDLEVFATMPLRENRVFAVNFYDPGFGKPEIQYYTVTGSEKLAGYDQQPVDCWLLQHGDDKSSETFWISKKTHEVLKLEEQYNGLYRYKIKLPFSI